MYYCDDYDEEKKFDHRTTEEIQVANLKKGKPINAGTKWSEEHKRLAKQVYRTGIDIFFIAEKLGRTPYAIKKKLEEMGFPVPDMKYLERKKAKKDRETKKERDSYAQIEDFFD